MNSLHLRQIFLRIEKADAVFNDEAYSEIEDNTDVTAKHQVAFCTKEVPFTQVQVSVPGVILDSAQRMI